MTFKTVPGAVGILLVVGTAATVGSASFLKMEDAPSANGLLLVPEYELQLIAEIDGAFLQCLRRMFAEARCHLFLETYDGGVFPTHLHADNPQLAVLVAPDKNAAMVIEESVAYLITSDRGNWRTISSAPAGSVFGSYSSLPSFYPSGRWLDAGTVELQYFPASTVVEDRSTAEGEWFRTSSDVVPAVLLIDVSNPDELDPYLPM